GDDVLRVLAGKEAADGHAEPHDEEIEKGRGQDLGLARTDRFTGAARCASFKIVALRWPFEAQACTRDRARRIRRILNDAGDGLDCTAEILAARIRSRHNAN